MDKKQKANSGRKPNIFGSLSGFFCQCSGEERITIVDESEYQMKARALSSDISTSTASQLFREMEEELLVKRDPYDYTPCLIAKPNHWHPVSEYEISQDKKNMNIYSWGRYHAFLGQGKNIGQKAIGFFEPSINLESEKPITLSFRFNQFSKVSGVGISYESLTEGISYNIGTVNKRRNQWIQANMLNPENEHPNQQKINNLNLRHGGFYIINEIGQDKSTFICNDRIEFVPITWKEKDHIIMAFNPKKNSLNIQVINHQNFECKSFDLQVDIQSMLQQEEKQKDQPVHFSFILDQLGDALELLGDPEANHVKQKTPPQTKPINYYDLSQKYYLDQGCCSTRIKFENKSMDCVLLYSDNYYLFNHCYEEEKNCYMFAYFKPCIPFPSEKLYIKRVAFLIENLGVGELFLGITREAYAIHNADIDTPKPEEDWLGRRVLFRSSGKELGPPQNPIIKYSNSFSNGQLVIIEYNPFTDCLTMINQQNVKSVINNLYADFTEKEFQDKQNRYCFCVGGASNFRVCLYNDYFDDIEESLKQ
ncbi:hypothetical protein TTHERM_00411940 (macronuclear) [Tetrahymena thermophila SB210]|uniref:Uncharacterized protein n=1 Tax=Tetrahymena thermophila (strain SB210) TaxID=312017 RepID=I7M2K7_TETTS|nr:hypothetical protein TTHERM_00411940 [Tetrahymena thermophila SB210]EAS00643.2 hypothetical protein TTHERM_00411940 [Tetrahymena thermophila SB210]|eukprot:XP_001020888.2 hypothetical protein TTHERM_00411940 [Tetrahymena thermophila SB210]